MPDKIGVFISHITEEKAVALELQRYLRLAFGEGFLVFVSSDPRSIGGGRAWWNHIRQNLKTVKVVLVLLSNESAAREWINYEAGVGGGAEACVIPVAIDGYSLSQFDFPLKGFQGRSVEDLEGLLGDIEREMGLRAAQLDQKQYETDIAAAAGRIIRRGITLEPFLEMGDGANPLLRFKVSNTGTRDVELLEIEAAVPRELVNPPDWRPDRYPVIRRNYRAVEGVEYLVLTESAYGGHLDRIRYGTSECLPPLFARNMAPRVLAFLKFPLRADLDKHEAAQILYRVIAKGLNLPQLTITVAYIPVLKR